jgi:hypothetical protein
VFHFVRAPTHQDVGQEVGAVAHLVCRMLRRRGFVAEPSHESNESKPVRASHAAVLE